MNYSAHIQAAAAAVTKKVASASGAEKYWVNGTAEGECREAILQQRDTSALFRLCTPKVFVTLCARGPEPESSSPLERRASSLLVDDYATQAQLVAILSRTVMDAFCGARHKNARGARRFDRDLMRYSRARGYFLWMTRIRHFGLNYSPGF